MQLRTQQDVLFDIREPTFCPILIDLCKYSCICWFKYQDKKIYWSIEVCTTLHGVGAMVLPDVHHRSDTMLYSFYIMVLLWKPFDLCTPNSSRKSPLQNTFLYIYYLITTLWDVDIIYVSPHTTYSPHILFRRVAVHLRRYSHIYLWSMSNSTWWIWKAVFPGVPTQR